MTERMKTYLEKPAVNISKLMGGKDEKTRGEVYIKNFGLIYILFTGNIEWKSK